MSILVVFVQITIAGHGTNILTLDVGTLSTIFTWGGVRKGGGDACGNGHGLLKQDGAFLRYASAETSVHATNAIDFLFYIDLVCAHGSKEIMMMKPMQWSIYSFMIYKRLITSTAVISKVNLLYTLRD